MAERVKIRFTKNAPPYYEGDVAGWVEAEAVRLVEVLKVAEYVVKAEAGMAGGEAPAKPEEAKPAEPAKEPEKPVVTQAVSATPAPTKPAVAAPVKESGAA